tara:strand:+ start:608 stop:748 length:141 start_codon:yes stop_codon:yes gene_type:complete
MLEFSIEENFMKPMHNDIWNAFEDPEKVLEAIHQSKPWSKDALKHS